MGGPFSFAGNLCGPELLCKWLFKDKASAEKLLRIGLEHTLDLVLMWKKHFGTDRIMTFTGEPYSSNQLISPKMFKEYSLPIMKKLHQNILDMGFKHIYCHICGEHNANLEAWAEIPMGDPGIVSMGHEIDVTRAAEVFPNDIIAGNLNPTLMVTGGPGVILQESKNIIEKGLCPPGQGGRFVEEGHASLGGRVPVNPSGGLLSRGHPVGATGVAQIIEVVNQLRGLAGPRQIEGARIGLAHCMGGDKAGDTKSCTVAILSA